MIDLKIELQQSKTHWNCSKIEIIINAFGCGLNANKFQWIYSKIAPNTTNRILTISKKVCRLCTQTHFDNSIHNEVRCTVTQPFSCVCSVVATIVWLVHIRPAQLNSSLSTVNFHKTKRDGTSFNRWSHFI